MDKHFICSAAIFIAAAMSVSGCRKGDNEPAVSSENFKNTIWTGEFSYAGKAAEPVSLDFTEDGQFLWHELKGNFAGSWKLEGKKLSLSLDNGLSFTGDVAGSSLSNLRSSDAGGRTLKNAVLDKEDIPALANTTWVATGVSLVFKPGNLVDLYFGLPEGFPTYYDMKYTLSGRAVHFNPLPDYNWFGVLSGKSFLKGTNHAPNDPTVYTFLGVKQ